MRQHLYTRTHASSAATAASGNAAATCRPAFLAAALGEALALVVALDAVVEAACSVWVDDAVLAAPSVVVDVIVGDALSSGPPGCVVAAAADDAAALP